MAAENCLWGAPRIHGELLKLGIAISERTVSRYLQGRPITRSQSWRTFFANHFGDQTVLSPVMVADAHDESMLVDASYLSFRSSSVIDASCTSITGSSNDSAVRPTLVPWRASRSTITFSTVQARKSRGRDLPPHLRSQAARSGTVVCSCVANLPLRPTAV
jgi:hypothetical protein